MDYPTQLEPVIGGRVLVDFSPEEPLAGIVCAAEANTLLTYTWGDSLLKWELAAADRGVRLTFSHIAVKREFVIGLSAGWHCFLDNLESHLRSETLNDRFDELYERYKAELGRLV